MEGGCADMWAVPYIHQSSPASGVGCSGQILCGGVEAVWCGGHSVVVCVMWCVVWCGVVRKPSVWFSVVWSVWFSPGGGVVSSGASIGSDQHSLLGLMCSCTGGSQKAGAQTPGHTALQLASASSHSSAASVVCCPGKWLMAW